MPDQPWCVRFSPSPTGALHIGTLRTALFDWLSARHTGGQFILRIEDTDRDRYFPGSEQHIVESLQWLGLQWDEGPDIGGSHAPYIQSQRLELYAQYGDELARRGAAYWCMCTPQRLDEMRKQQQAAGQPTRYDRHCWNQRDEIARQHAAGTPAVLRQYMPPGTSQWTDLVHGDVTFNNADIDDSVLLKSDGFPTYHLAVVVDDHLMDITHVLRGEEWIPSTPKHLALYSALHWQPPVFAHVSIVLGTDGKKLSKRFGARDVLDYRDHGYLPEAVANTIALLGWSPATEQEVFTLPELCQQFSFDHVNAAPAILDPKRLDALNGMHIRKLSPDDFARTLHPWLPNLSQDDIAKIAPLLQERIVRLEEAADMVAPLVTDPPWNDELPMPPAKVSADVAGKLLTACIDDIMQNGLNDVDGLRHRLTELLDSYNTKARDGFRVFYAAILRRPAGVPVFDAMQFIGKEKTLDRLREALGHVSTQRPSGTWAERTLGSEGAESRAEESLPKCER